jgi:hypothetical protein
MYLTLSLRYSPVFRSISKDYTRFCGLRKANIGAKRFDLSCGALRPSAN